MTLDTFTVWAGERQYASCTQLEAACLERDGLALVGVQRPHVRLGDVVVMPWHVTATTEAGLPVMPFDEVNRRWLTPEADRRRRGNPWPFSDAV